MYSVKKITCLYNLVLLWICLLLADDLITFLKRLFSFFFFLKVDSTLRMKNNTVSRYEDTFLTDMKTTHYNP